MNDVKKIVLIISASNFERQKSVIKSVHAMLKKMGGYALYIFSSYGIYTENSLYNDGEASIYELINRIKPDGCILEGNIGNSEMLKNFASKLSARNIPFVTLNFGIKNIPLLSFDSYTACCRIMDHLISVHGCRRINIVLNDNKDIVNIKTINAYKDMLNKYGIDFDERRIVITTVSVKNGRKLYTIFKERDIEDAQAVLCTHDVCAIGLCLELEERGYKVPKDMLLCSLNRSTNSMAFRPDITGVDRMDSDVAGKACEILDAMLKGNNVPLENCFAGNIYFGRSCGCKSNENVDEIKSAYQEMVISKIETGNQISRMMQYYESVEAVVSLDELGNSIYSMLRGINCKEFICCLNNKTLKCILNEKVDDRQNDETDERKVFDEVMVALTGTTERTEKLNKFSFPINNLIPIEQREGDMFLFLPIHHKDNVFGYMVFVNEYLPIELYNYRICHESIGNGIENLHKKLMLENTIKELDNLHMRDQLTGMYNRFAMMRFKEEYIKSGIYTVAMLDMDNLKTVNDKFGHLAGNHAICIMADVIRETIGKDDLAIRYGGDEFVILSKNTDEAEWEMRRRRMNEMLANHVEWQKLPYSMGVSMGYVVANVKGAEAFEYYCGMADRAMYENKKADLKF